MKTPFKNIYDVLRLNRLIVLSVVISGAASVIFAGWITNSIYQKAMDNAFAINTDGAVIPLKLVSQKENFEVEALSHLERFHQNFYGFNSSNYEKNTERALWLGDSSVDDLYREKRADGVYNRILQYSLMQDILEIKSVITETGKGHSFQTTTKFVIKRGSTSDYYELITSGNLITVDRQFPNNPHGLLITDFFENSLKKIDHETSEE